MTISNKFKKFILKYSLISSLIVWAAGSHFKDFTQCIIESMIHPFLSLDLDNNGEPDLKQIKEYNRNIFNIKFPIGKLLIGIIDFIFTMLLIFGIIWLFVKYSSFIKIN